MAFQPSYPVVLVKWRDIARFSDPWVTMQQAMESKPLDCYSVGWLLLHDDERLVLLTTVGDEDADDVGGCMSLPACVVIDVIGLERLPIDLTEEHDG